MSSIIDPTKQEDKNVNQLLYCMETHPNTVVQFHASGIILRTDTNASYLTEPQACSRSAGYFFLGSIASKCSWERLNDPVHANRKF